MFPRIIHRIWIGTPAPEWLARFTESWDRLHPHWALALWDDRTVQQLFPLDNQHLYDNAQDYTDAGHVPQFRSDLLRYEILWRYGGMYVDADFRCLRPLDGLLAGSDCFATFEQQGKWVANGLMGSTPQHPFIRRLIDGLPASVAEGGRPTKMSGPQYLTGLWRTHGGLDVLDQRHFYPYSYRDVTAHPIDEPVDDPEVYAVHVWNNQRRRSGL